MGKSMYCEKCGWVGGVLFSRKCSFCGTKMKVLSEELMYKYHIFVEDWLQISREEKVSRREKFVMGELLSNPLFSLEDYEKQVQRKAQINQDLNEYEKQKMLEQQAKNLAQMQKEKDKQNCIPKCPTCGSTNVEKISIGKKAVGGAMFGVMSSDIRNTMHCKNCGAKW